MQRNERISQGIILPSLVEICLVVAEKMSFEVLCLRHFQRRGGGGGVVVNT